MAYSRRTGTILLMMIITGSFRSVAVKLMYQIGLQSPYFVTLLYLLGQSLSLVVDWFGRRLGWLQQRVGVDDHGDHNHARTSGGHGNGAESIIVSQNRKRSKKNAKYSDIDSFDGSEHFGGDVSHCIEMSAVSLGAAASFTDTKWGGAVDCAHNGSNKEEATGPNGQEAGDSYIERDDDDGDGFVDEELRLPPHTYTADDVPNQAQGGSRRPRSGSDTGLTDQSSAAVSYIHSIPTKFKPAIPGLFNLVNSSMRWASLIYVAASTAEMMISGLELILSTVASKLIRKRQISQHRWGGVLFVAAGLVIVRLSEGAFADWGDVGGDDDYDDYDADDAEADDGGAASPRSDRLIGDVLIVGQCVMSVLQDMAEELFMHESSLAPTLLLGWEGVFGLAFGLPLYLPLAPLVGEDPSETWAVVRSSPARLAYVSGLVLLFTVTGILNIAATGVTSSMTRNVWKNFRSAVVWIMGLAIYYSSGNTSLGEAWRVPASFGILLGFAVMILGVCLYYHKPEADPAGRGCFSRMSRIGLERGYDAVAVGANEGPVAPTLEPSKEPYISGSEMGNLDFS